MNINYEIVKEILVRLPISYYLKRGTSVVLSKEESESFIDLISGSIVVSYDRVKESKAETKEELEKDIRTLLYHEISHAILTPRPSKYIIDKNIFNCFEDERCETLLKDYYLDVDFKEYLIKYSTGKKAKENFDYFFHCVRLRGGGDEINNEVNRLIEKWKGLRFDFRTQHLEDYQKDIEKLYIMICKTFFVSKKKLEKVSAELIKERMETAPKTITEGEMREVSESIDRKLEQYEDKDFRRKAELILNSRKHDIAKNSESKKTYSGTLRVKSIGKPFDDYKWFTKKGCGTLKLHSSIKLNLFVDQSGSYRELELKTNAILKELALIERKTLDFSFNLITIDTDIEIKPKNNRFINCGGGNSLSLKTFDIFAKVQAPEAITINLVLFNGDMATDTLEFYGTKIPPFSDSQYINFKAFDRRNVIIISDIANKKPLDKYCKKCKIIYTKDYLKEFSEYILKSLKILIKNYWH